MDVSYLLDSLNDPQREAVAAAAGNQLVLAGAGSGKTRVLVHRIAWLMRVEGVSPQGILSVTFTNKAAKEMRHRIEDLMSIPTRGMWVGTFHGLAHRLLKAHWQAAGLPQNFQILDSDDQLRLIKRLMKEMNLDDARWPPRQAQWFINAQKDDGLRAAHINSYGDAYHQTMLSVYQAYEEACERGGMVDFGELLLRSHELWLNHPELLAHYQQRFKYILVDEFQDTNAIQYAWLRVLAGNQCHVMAVGDDDQSIYGWRGAKIENIQQYTKDFADVSTIRLEQNYRSSSNILDAANAVIDNNTDRLGKKLWTEGGAGELISLYAGFNEQDEARFIVEQIESHKQKGISASSELHAEDAKFADMAILYRSNAQSRVLEEMLLRENIPYRIYGGQRFYDRLEIKNALAYLRLLINRDDDAAIERVVNTPTRGIGGKTLEVVRQHARSAGVSLWRAANEAIELKLLTARAANALQAFIDLINRLHSDTESLNLAEQTDHVIECSGLLEFHKNEKGEKGKDRVENLEELVSACRQFTPDEAEEGDSLRQFLDNASLDAGDAQADEYEDSVQLMTLHSAKGLEFPLVFLAGLEENLFPHKMSMDEPGRLAEERRLCYVGITRAMSKLYITYAESRRLHGSETFNPPSRFLKEIPEKLLDKVRVSSKITRPTSYGSASYKQTDTGSYTDQSSDEEQPGIALGQLVWHKTFGEGTVLGIEGSGSSARVQVNFDKDGCKWLVLQYAKLQPL
jgi:DNA helicase-2/ATP-dependent DNA helicase PcrA